MRRVDFVREEYDGTKEWGVGLRQALAAIALDGYTVLHMQYVPTGHPDARHFYAGVPGWLLVLSDGSRK